MGKIFVNNIRVHAHHGCLREEGIIGSAYRVDLVLEADLSLSASSDRLRDTLDYGVAYQVVRDAMAQRSHLLEHVANRILDGLFSAFPALERAEVTVAKINPPIGGDVENVAVLLERSRA